MSRLSGLRCEFGHFSPSRARALGAGACNEGEATGAFGGQCTSLRWGIVAPAPVAYRAILLIEHAVVSGAGAPSRQLALDRLVPPCGWDDGVVGLLQADSNSTTLMSGTFNVERQIHRKQRLHPDGRASPVPAGRSTRARQLGVALGGSRKTTLADPD